MSIGEKLYFAIKIKLYFFSEWIKEALRYYSNIKFMCFDISFNLIYFFFNPYRISRRFLEKKLSEKIHDYGETPLIQMEKIVKNFEIQSSDKILEMGAGRGKVSFWLHFFLKCRITAIEQIPFFVKTANFLIKLFKMRNCYFLCNDFFSCEFGDFDVIYLYGTTLENKQIAALISKFKHLSSKVRIITVSYSLNEYDESFICLKNLEVIFPWGRTTVYLNKKRG